MSFFFFGGGGLENMQTELVLSFAFQLLFFVSKDCWHYIH